MEQNNTLWKSVFFPYVSYVSLFLGMGLISGAIVHMPLDPARYSLIMGAGVVLFGFASFVNDMSKQTELTTGAIVRSLVFSLLISVGIGMMSGGVQHFSDNPTYSAMLIPSGFGLSLFSFVLKNNTRLSVKRFYAVVLIFAFLALPLKLSLDYMVQNTEQSGDGHGGHGGH